VAAVHSDVYGVATYARSDLDDITVLNCSTLNNISSITIELSKIKITNIYKPPNEIWPTPPLPCYEHPAIYVGDFNSHHESWGYDRADQNGDIINEWAQLNAIDLLYCAKGKGTFHSARWRKDYTPDLSFVTCPNTNINDKATRLVLDDFPHSQHRPVIIKYGIRVPLTNTVPLPRWNFKKADWKSFSRDLDKVIQHIPCQTDCYNRFTGAIISSAKKHVPRGFRREYIPAWDKTCEELYKRYQETHETTVAEELLQALNRGRQERWNETVRDMDFRHSSQKAWCTLRRLGAAPPKLHAPSTTSVTADDIVKHMVSVSRISVTRERVKEVNCDLKKLKAKLSDNPTFSEDFSLADLNSALRNMKCGKAAGLDEIYPEFIRNMGPHAKEWLVQFMNETLRTGKLPKLWKHSKVVAILKPGKDGSSANHYRPISLLCIPYKLLERLILQRISTSIDAVIPIEQAGFRAGRDCTEQVLALTSNIEAGFQRGLKFSAAFIDLSAAYDTVWRKGLLTKLAEAIPCRKIMNLLNNMLASRYIRVSLGGRISRIKVLNNGLPQGSVLAPVLFNLYVHDIPQTDSLLFQYADDIALLAGSKDLDTGARTLERDLEKLSTYFRNWRLKPNPNKTEVTTFHLNNRQSNSKINVHFEGVLLNHTDHPKYLGVTLDRTLTFKRHIDSLCGKLKSRNNVIQKLAGSLWGANAETLRTAGLSLVYSTAEYCAPVWDGSAHVKKVDVQLNTTMRTITGALKPTQRQWLPVLANIAPPHVRRDVSTMREWDRAKTNTSLLSSALNNIPSTRLKSRRPFWSRAQALEAGQFSAEQAWQLEWQGSDVKNRNLISDPTKRVAGFELERREWVKLNRIRTGCSRSASERHKWGYIADPRCDCGAESQTLHHLIHDCPTHRFTGLMEDLNNLTTEAIEWLRDIHAIL
jgi:hypothetical protein